MQYFQSFGTAIGDMAIRKNRERMCQVWLGSSLFRVSGLNRSDVQSRILDDCCHPDKFLRVVMEVGIWSMKRRPRAWTLPDEKQQIATCLRIDQR
jgi:hypothetical protein